MKNHKTISKMQTMSFLVAGMLLLLPGWVAAAAEGNWIHLGADNNFGVWHQPTGDWYEAGDAMLDPNENQRLVGKPGTGVLMNHSRTNSLITKQTFQDVEVHLEFMVAKGANSGVIFHGNYEIQILDSAHVETATGAHCGGVYPRAEGKPSTPSYHHIDEGSPPRINAAKPAGQWQTLDIIFQSPRFDEAGNKTANARFARVVHNGLVVQENQEVPYAHGPNWDRQQFPRGVIIFQGDYGLVAFRNIRVRPWNGKTDLLNVPPEGFTALFNGKDLTGWHTPPEVLEYWSIEDGVLKSPGLLRQWGACLATKKHYRDFILMLDFRMPTLSDSGINFRRLIPEIPGFGDQEQFNLRSKGGMGHLESYYFLPKQTAEKMGLKEEEKPHVRHIDPEVGVWHTVKLTMKGRTFSAEYDGEVLHDNFEFHDWMMNMEPAPIRLQKHIVVRGDNLGKENPCPIEYRNIFIKEFEPGTVEVPVEPSASAAPNHKPVHSTNEELLVPKQKKNVLFIAVDDLNDWVGCLRGHPQAKTPHIDRLAEKGVLFEQAYCAAPLCNPSRTAIMTGLNPSTTGIYGNKAWFRDHPKFKDWVTIPQYFRKCGYIAWTGGKIYHQPDGKWSDPIAWNKQYSKKMGSPAPPPEKRFQHGMHDMFSNKILQRLIDWAPIEQSTEETNDWKTANLAAEVLQQEHDKPFFLGCGICRPHLSWYAPKKYFDMHPLENIQLPTHKENDLDDVPSMGRRMAGKDFNIIKKHGQWKNAVQGYLASCSFADACVGHVLSALEKSKYRDNTIVVLWGDHGYHLGEKDHFAKSALWEETSRTPLIIYAPGISKSQNRCKRPVSLVDIYPTLIELCGLPGRDDLDGRSLAPLVRNPERDWPYPALITHSPYWYGTNHAIHSQRYHYIHYRDGGEELYDNTADPYGWKNLADDPKYAEAKEKLKKWLPKVNAEHFRPEALGNR